jgi:aminoglycoside phosphotransferase
VLEWCAGRLPVAKVLEKRAGFLAMSALPGVDLTETSMECAAQIIAEALHLVHAMPTETCPFMASWAKRLSQAELRIRSGLVDESDFDEANLGRFPKRRSCRIAVTSAVAQSSLFYPRGCLSAEFPQAGRKVDWHR